jgi:hypothetical protein
VQLCRQCYFEAIDRARVLGSKKEDQVIVVDND